MPRRRHLRIPLPRRLRALLQVVNQSVERSLELVVVLPLGEVGDAVVSLWLTDLTTTAQRVRRCVGWHALREPVLHGLDLHLFFA